MNMNKECGSCCGSCCGAWLYTVFRIIVGGLFLWHGVAKLMVWQNLPLLFQTAGVIETIVGALVLVGLYTRYAAIAGAVVMLVALVKVHLAQSWIFVSMGQSNGGEAALLNLAAFLVLHMMGNGSFALGNLFCSHCSCECEGDSCEVKAAPVAKAAKKKARK